MRRSRAFFMSVAAIIVVAVPAAAQLDDDPEIRLEQLKALEADQAGPQARGGEVFLEGVTAPGDLLFIAVDDATVSTYNLLPTDGTPFAQFTGYEIWGAALIPDATPGNGVVYFNDGSTLYRWPANGSPELCCTLTYSAATASVVSMTYDPVLGRLLMTRNVTTEAVYALPVVAASCPATCEMTQEIVYASADNDFGGLARSPFDGLLYGTNDDSSPGPAGVYRINVDGSTTLIAAYPTGQTDIDGLAADDNGKLYLIIDEPGDIFILDIATGTYDPPIPNPWTSSEVFCGGALGQGLIPVELQSFNVE